MAENNGGPAASDFLAGCGGPPVASVERLSRTRGRPLERRLPQGAEVQPNGGVHFRVWAPDRRRVAVALPASAARGADERLVLEAEGEGYFSGYVAAAADGDLYWFALDEEDRPYPDPASRFQPSGPHGPSQVVDPTAFQWTDSEWCGIGAAGQVLYEMHVGTFTPEGNWEAAARQLSALAEIGITCLEVMPVNDFPGHFGWGYDGVNFYAPTRLYGTPDDLRAFVDAAHRVGLAVILDVVYNHVGPDGNFFPQFGRQWFSDRHKTDWGPAPNFDGENSGPVREFFIANAGYWIEEFHLDGLRLDATQNVEDDSDPHILAEIVSRVREAATPPLPPLGKGGQGGGGGRSTFIVAENEPQDSRMLKPRALGGYGIDAMWNDDFHHSSMVLLSGHSEAYYSDYRGSPQEFLSAIKWGFLYQGQWYSWQKQRRGTAALDLEPYALVHFIQNHDQIANTCRGLRCHEISSPGCYRALTALLLLVPQTPMLFQGQEFASSSPFYYFADHRDDLARAVHAGRREFMKQFRSLAIPEVQARLPNPADPATFVRSKLDFSERERHAEAYAMHRELLRLRREDPVFRLQQRRTVDGAVLGEDTFVLRFFAADGLDRLLFINFGADLHYDPAPEPLLAPPAGCDWGMLWSSEDFAYGGTGTPSLETEDNWRIPGQAAVALRASPRTEGGPSA
ncbi:MAG: malto-oligosyltrehalose trehalohydrolase [Planctomycetes bacterium]|nr:malto-oligosyltrehalose trehalohydrolase [Planctomycetota bacterium]